MLKMTVIGNLGRDAEIREAGSARVISFAVAHSEKYRDRQTNMMVEKTVWVNCSYWRDPDKTGVAQYLTKGKKVYVEGTPSSRAYTDRDGNMRASLDLRVLNLELLSSAGEGGPNPNYGQGGGQPEGQSGNGGEQNRSAAEAREQAAGYDAGAPQQHDAAETEDDLPF